jgi:hypothetical protein
MNKPELIVDELTETFNAEPVLAKLLERSLIKAGEFARAELNPDLFAALGVLAGAEIDVVLRQLRPSWSAPRLCDSCALGYQRKRSD